MKKLFLLILIPLLLFACSKSPTETNTFLLEVDNQTILDLKIYVDGAFAGDSDANTKVEMGDWTKGENTHLEAKYDTLTVLNQYQDTREFNKVTLLIAM
jgi:uncharacterized protein YcfL